MDLKKLIDREIWSMNENAPLNEEVFTLYHGSPYEFHKFSLNNIGTGEGLDKFGHGLYFTDSKEKAEYYANELSIGDHKETGFNIYQVRVHGDFLNWDEEIPSNIHDRVVNGLIRLGYDQEAETMQRELEEYGTYWTMDSLYQFLTATFSSRKEVSEFLVDCHVDGVYATNRAYVGNVYVSFRDDNVKIIQTMKIGDEDGMYSEGHIVENVQQLDKELLKTNKITPEDKENILSITNGDNYSFIVGFFYAWLFNPTAPAYNTQEKRNAQFRSSHYNKIFRDLYESVRTYNKNVFPIKNYDITLKNIHPIELIGGLQARHRILSFLKRMPSLYTRNLAADIRIPRDENELKYDVEAQINRIRNGLKLVDRLSDDKKEVIYKKIFSSNNKTFKQVADQLEKMEILFLSHDDAEDEVRTKVENLDGEAEVLYDENNIMVVDIRSSDAMKTLGCGSQWCFATEHGVGHWHKYADNSHVNIVYNFNEEPDSKTRMVVVLPTGEVYNMYNEYMDGSDGMDGWDYLESIGISDVTNANVVNDSYLAEYADVGTTFDVQKFDQLDSFAKRKRYADETLQKLGVGSSRIVYKIDDHKILKLAKNAKGLDQNREECGLGQDYYFKDILTEVYDCHTDDLWIISELARKATPAKFKQLVGIDIKYVEMYLRNKEEEHRGRKPIFGIDPKFKEQLSENMFVQKLLELMYSYELLSGDLGRISSYGIVMRDGQESIVVADYGLTKDVFNTHYSPKGYKFEGRNITEDYFAEEPSISKEIVNNKKMRKPVFSIAGLSESLDNYRNVSDAIVKQTSNYFENLTNIVRPSNGKELSKLFRLYLIASQNVERALKFSENDIDFYNNLLKVQDILKKFGLLKEDLVYSHVSDASPESDEYQIVNEEVAGFAKDLADEISMKAAEKLGMPLPYFLGEGGFGYAYQSGDKVIKITKDQSEAVENLKLKGKRFARIAETYGVYATEYKTSGENSIYIIVLEKLNTANAQQLYFRLSQILENDYGESLDDVMETFHYYGGQKWEMKYEEIDYYLMDEPEVKDFFDQFIEIAKEAKQAGVESQDYMNKYNLGYKKDGKLAFFDVGFGQYDFRDEKPELLHVKEDGTSLYTDVQGTVNEDSINKNKYFLRWTSDAEQDINDPLRERKQTKKSGVNENSTDYNKWKRNNVSYRGISSKSELSTPNYAGELLGKGLYSVPASNKQMARQYGKLYILVNARPKNPKIFSSLNEAEIWIQQIIHKISGGDFPDKRVFYEKGHTIEDEVQKLGYDGIFIKGREMVNYKPENVIYFENEQQLRDYYNNVIANSNDSLTEHKTTQKGNVVFFHGTTQDKANKILKDALKASYYEPEWFTLAGQDEIGLAMHHAKSRNKGKTPAIIQVTLPKELVNKYVYREGGLKQPIPSQYLKQLTPDQINNIDNNHNIVYEDRKISYMPDSSTVDVKKKCKLAGNGDGTSTACNQGDMDNLEIKSLGESNERKNPRYGVLMLGLDVPKWKNIISRIKDNDLFGYGRENNPHVTLLYGFKSDVTYETIEPLLSELKPIDIYVKGISIFNSNPEYDVVKFDVELTSELKATREVFEKLPHVKMFDEYRPHITIAYVKAGEGQKYVKEFKNRIRLRSGKFVFQDKNKNRVEYDVTQISDLVESENNNELNESYHDNNIYYHGSTDKSLAGRHGIHVGTKLAATQALQARIGVPSEGEWDGTRKYGETLLAGKKRLEERSKELGYFVSTGHNSGPDVPEEDYYPTDRIKKAKYSDGTPIPLDSKPIVFPVKIVGKMTNTPQTPHSDATANGLIMRNLRMGNARRGYYYKNDGEDYGSISAVVPDSSFLKIIESNTNEQVGNIEENMMVEANILTLNDLPFKEDIEGMGGKIYSVGGAVRDEFLGKESKDLDILITGVPFDHLEELLAHYGKVDAVGKSFGIIKFKPHGSIEDIDIAIPRTERATGEGGHKGFEVSSDHNLPIEKDLERRDFTINAIAKDVNGNIIDPFGGQKDLQRKIIRIVNPEAFSDDPLRMLRAVQFAARFGFVIEPNTKQMISANAARIKEIPAERILTELDKIVKKGDVLYGADLLRETGLYEHIFGSKPSPEFESWWDLDAWDHVRTLGEYVFLLSYPAVDKPAEFYKTNLKGDIPTQKEIAALDIAYSENFDSKVKNRIIAHNMYSMSPASLDSGIVSPHLKNAIQELKSGKYPKGLKELAVNGNDLMQRGLKGKELGDTLKLLLVKVYSDKVENNKEDLLASLSLGQP